MSVRSYHLAGIQAFLLLHVEVFWLATVESLREYPDDQGFSVLQSGECHELLENCISLPRAEKTLDGQNSLAPYTGLLEVQ